MTRCIAAVVVMSVLAGCGSIDTAAPEAAREESSAPTAARADFEAWLAAQCPDGRTVRVMDDAGEHGDIACAELRESILEHGDARAEAEKLYEQSFAAGTVLPAGPERVGEAQEKFSPVGAACSLVTLALGLIFSWPFGHSTTGCNDPHADNPSACKAVTQGASIGLGIACWFI